MVKIKLESEAEWRGLSYDWPPDYKITHTPDYYPCMAVMSWTYAGVSESVEVVYIYLSDFQRAADKKIIAETPVKYINPILPPDR
jgi:hypothetical protein